MDLEYFLLNDLFSYSFDNIAKYTTQDKSMTKLCIASGRDPAKIEQVVSLIGRGFQGEANKVN